MTAAWKTYPSAPPAGQAICPATEVTDSVLSLAVNSENGEFPLLILRLEDGFRAFVNACPHQYLPLDYRGDQVLSADRQRLLCTSHGAEFLVDTGEGVAGYGLGCELDCVPVQCDASGILRIAED